MKTLVLLGQTTAERLPRLYTGWPSLNLTAKRRAGWRAFGLGLRNGCSEMSRHVN